MLTALPYTSGATKLPWTMLNTIVKIAITAMSVGVPTATVTRNAIPVVMNDADVRDEPAEERQDRQRERERDPQQCHDRELGGRTECRDDAGRDHVAAQDAGRPGAGRVDLGPPPAMKPRGRPTPCGRAVAQEEEGQDRRQRDHQHQAGRDRGERDDGT